MLDAPSVAEKVAITLPLSAREIRSWDSGPPFESRKGGQPLGWCPLDKVEKVVRGRDQLIRAVHVRCLGRTYVRSVHRVYPIEHDVVQWERARAQEADASDREGTEPADGVGPMIPTRVPPLSMRVRRNCHWRNSCGGQRDSNIGLPESQQQRK